MKNLILTSIFIAGAIFFVSGQDLEPNSVKLKVKQKAGKFKYNYLPEFSNYSENKNYQIKLTDVTGQEYITRSDLGKDVQVKLKLSYIENLIEKKSDGHFLIEIKRTKSSLDNVSTTQYPTGKPTPETTYGYELVHNDEYKVTMKDIKGGGGVIYDTTLVVNTKSYFPKDYNASLKIRNKNSLPRYYNDFIYKNVPKDYIKENEGEYEAMKIKEDKDVTEKYYDYTFNNPFPEVTTVSVPLSKAVNGNIHLLFVGKVSRSWDTKVIWLYAVKAKDEAYNEINLAIESFQQGMDAINDNYKNKIYTNFHAENAYAKMDAAYTTFNKFSDDKYILALQEKVQKEYKYAMDFNTFFTALATSRYDEANEILSQIQSEASKQPNSGLKRSDAQKTLALMEPYISILKREQQLYDAHKEQYGFYK